MTDTAWHTATYHRAGRAPAAAGTSTRGSPSRTPARTRRPAQGRVGGRDEWLTVEEVCAELNIGRRTFDRWRALGIAPRATRPTRNGRLKIKRSWLDEWAEAGAQ
jgi:excisionase family DNA binding protein